MDNWIRSRLKLLARSGSLGQSDTPAPPVPNWVPSADAVPPQQRSKEPRPERPQDNG